MTGNGAHIIDPTLYHLDQAKDFLQWARDETIKGDFVNVLKMLDQVQYHRDQARNILLGALKK